MTEDRNEPIEAVIARRKVVEYIVDRGVHAVYEDGGCYALSPQETADLLNAARQQERAKESGEVERVIAAARRVTGNFPQGDAGGGVLRAGAIQDLREALAALNPGAPT